MDAPNDKPDHQMRRNWEEIAQQLSAESDPDRVAELVHELNEAMLEEERSKARRKLAGPAL